MTTTYHRDPKTQPQIGEEVVYLPEAIITKVIAYEWDASSDPKRAPKLKRYQLACGVTVTGDHIAQGSGSAPVSVFAKAEIARIAGESAVQKELADEAKAKQEADARAADAVARKAQVDEAARVKTENGAKASVQHK